MAVRRKGALVAISLSTCLVTAILTTGGSKAYASGPEQAQPGAVKTAVHNWPTPWVPWQPEIVAHRGDITAATPNTPGAIRAAFDNGADAVEFDVQWTKDGQPVVLHDSHLSKQTKNCTKRSFEIDYTAYRACKTHDGKTAPNAYEALLPVRDAGKKAYIHVKAPGKPGTKPSKAQAVRMAEKLMGAVNKYGLNRGGHTVFFSDQRNMLDALRDAGAANLGLIFNNDSVKAGWESNYPVLIPYNTPITLDLVRKAQARGQAVFPVESFPLSLDEARVMGVDGVLANDLAGAIATFR